MASPLQEIDWNNLSSAEVTTAIRLLMLTSEERYSIGRMNINGVITGNPFFNPTHAAVGNYYPMGTPTANNPDYGEPNWGFSGARNDYIENILDYAAVQYVDKAKFDSYVGLNRATNQFFRVQLSGPADDPGTYHNRMFELAGIPGTDGSQYPDLSSGSPVEVKKWYDLITQCKWAYPSQRDPLIQQGAAGDNNVQYDGEYEPDTGSVFVVDNDGCENYGLGTGESNVSDSTAYDAWLAAHTSLFGTFSTSLTLDVINGKPFPPGNTIYLVQIRRDSFGNYKPQTLAYTKKILYDWSTMQSVLNFTGRPLGYDVIQYPIVDELRINNPDPSWPGDLVDDLWYKSNPSFVDVGVDKSEVTLNHTWNKVDFSASTFPPPSNSRYELQVRVSEQRVVEFWDGDGGFVYYT